MGPLFRHEDCRMTEGLMSSYVRKNVWDTMVTLCGDFNLSTFYNIGEEQVTENSGRIWKSPF